MTAAPDLHVLDTLDGLVLEEERFNIACIVNFYRELCWIYYRARAQAKHASKEKRCTEGYVTAGGIPDKTK